MIYGSAMICMYKYSIYITVRVNNEHFKYMFIMVISKIYNQHRRDDHHHLHRYHRQQHYKNIHQDQH